MGRIKQIFLKRIAKKLMREYPDEFKKEFEHNKHKVQEYTDIDSKPMRNKIAGHITRTVKKQEAKVL